MMCVVVTPLSVDQLERRVPKQGLRTVDCRGQGFHLVAPRRSSGFVLGFASARPLLSMLQSPQGRQQAREHIYMFIRLSSISIPRNQKSSSIYPAGSEAGCTVSRKWHLPQLVRTCLSQRAWSSGHPCTKTMVGPSDFPSM